MTQKCKEDAVEWAPNGKQSFILLLDIGGISSSFLLAVASARPPDDVEWRNRVKWKGAARPENQEFSRMAQKLRETSLRPGPAPKMR